ncbi:hypothetical protein PVAP13_5KG022600, partial [Panicum virgatum]
PPLRPQRFLRRRRWTWQPLNAELAAKSARIAELEARVSLLQAENARLREALARGEATGRTGARDPESGRLAAGPGGIEREAVEKLGGEGVACAIIEVSDGDEEVAAVDGTKGRRNPEEGAVAAPTRRKRVVTSEGEGEADVDEDTEGGSGGSNGVDCGGLEDDDVSITPRGKRRAAARVVTSDSEDEGRGELGSTEDDAGDQEAGVASSRKRGLCGISDSDDEDVTEGVPVVAPKGASGVVAPQIESGDEDEDDTVPIRQVLKKMRKERASEDDAAADELREAGGRSAPTTRRSARLVKKQSKGGRASRRVTNFVEPKDYERSEDDMEEDDDMDGFINNDSSEDASDSAEESRNEESDVSGTSVPSEESSSGSEECDGVEDYKGVMARLGRRKKAKDWKFEGDMLAAFGEHSELCLKAVCALYRKQTQEEQMEKAALVHNKQGFSHIDAPRLEGLVEGKFQCYISCTTTWGSHIAEFLLGGDRDGPLMKTIPDLEKHDPSAVGFCRKVASNYSKQLFAIYQNKEDPYFHP